MSALPWSGSIAHGQSNGRTRAPTDTRPPRTCSSLSSSSVTPGTLLSRRRRGLESGTHTYTGLSPCRLGAGGGGAVIEQQRLVKLRWAACCAWVAPGAQPLPPPAAMLLPELCLPCPLPPRCVMPVCWGGITLNPCPAPAPAPHLDVGAVDRGLAQQPRVAAQEAAPRIKQAHRQRGIVGIHPLEGVPYACLPPVGSGRCKGGGREGGQGPVW